MTSYTTKCSKCGGGTGQVRACICAADALEARQERGEAVANQCDGCGRGLLLDDFGMHRAESGHPVMMCQRSRYAHPPADDARADEFVQENAARMTDAYLKAQDHIAALEAQLAESREREGRMREALREAGAQVVELCTAYGNPLPLASLARYDAALAANQEQTK